MPNRFVVCGALVAAAYLAPVSPAEAASGVIERVPAGLIFQGFIEDEAVDALDKELRSGDVLLIGSGGGEPAAALRLGNIVADRDVRVVVNGVCLNACASYVFLPARWREAALAFSVRFGPSPFLIEELVRARPEIFDPAEKERLAQHVAAYRSLLRSSGQVEDLLKCSDRSLLPNFIEATRGTRIDDAVFDREFLLPVDFNQAAASPSVLASYGITPLGEYSWPVEESWRQGVEEDAGVPVAWIDDAANCAE